MLILVELLHRGNLTLQMSKLGVQVAKPRSPTSLDYV